MADKQTVKVGDKVRSKYSCHSGGYDIGDVFTVTKVDGEFIEFVDKDGSDRLRPADEFDIPPVAGATGKPAFKVGDRVRVLSDYSPWASADEIGLVQAVDVCDRDCFVEFETERMGDHTWYVRWDNLEIAPPLTIEAGKFYRTRDGRKVGPATARTGDLYSDGPWRLDGWNYDNNGICSNLGGRDPKDLIAEWVDEPLATASTDAASNDNAPVAKFKVGDIVKRSGRFMPHQRLRITKALGDRYSVEWLEGGPGSIDNWRGYEFELAGPTSQPTIVALIENGQPKPSEKPKVHKSEQSATDEAERLAVKYPGQKFGVFVLADWRIADVVIRRAA